MKKIVFNLTSIFIAITIIGCTHIVDRYRVTIDAIRDPKVSIAPTTYYIKPLGKSTSVDELKFRRQSSRLAKILNQKGYTLAQNDTLANEIIYFDYGIERVKEETKFYSQPDVSFGISWGYPYGYYHHRYHYYSPFWNDIRYTSYRGYSKTYTLFNRYIVILAKDRAGRELWRVDVSSVGESDNLAKIVPILLRASKEYIGKDTNSPIELTISEKDSKKE